MNRTQKLKMNTRVSLLARLVMVISGLILPRLILSYYGAETHGLVNSINQFLGIITFLDLGVGAVVRSALYHPLVTKDNNQLSLVLIAAKDYFRKIAYALVIFVIGLIIFYPLLIDSTYSHLSTGVLIIALSISKFGQYYFGVVNELLLSANQQDYIQLGSEIVVVILNLLISIGLIYLGASIQIVKLVAGLIYLIRPFYLSFYVKNNFNIDYKKEVKEDPLPQKWNGMGQHLAYFVQNNTDIVVLTTFLTLEDVSIYSVYNMVVSALKQILHSLTSGIQSFFGDLYARKEIDLLNDYFNKIEWIVHTSVSFLYGMAVVLINSFVNIYTSGVEGISYEAPLFSLLIVLASVAYSVKTPYNSMVLSAGHFKQTQNSSFVEACLNIIISLLLVDRFGIIGVAIGTLVSMTYRTVYLVIYLSKNILFRSVRKFLKHVFVDFVSFSSVIIISNLLSRFYVIQTLIEWVIAGVLISITYIILLLIINSIFYKNTTDLIFKSIFR